MTSRSHYARRSQGASVETAPAMRFEAVIGTQARGGWTWAVAHGILCPRLDLIQGVWCGMKDVGWMAGVDLVNCASPLAVRSLPLVSQSGVRASTPLESRSHARNSHLRFLTRRTLQRQVR